jgi:uncharacterized protein
MPRGFHPGERVMQERLGETTRAEHVGNGTHDHMPAVAAQFLRAQSLLLLACRDTASRVWVSPLTGLPGFIAVPDDRTLRIHTHLPTRDPLDDACDSPADCGLLAIDFNARRRMRVNGTALHDGEDLIVHAREVFSNCPKHIQRRQQRGDQPACQNVPPAYGSALTEHQQAWIAACDTFFIGTHAAGYGADCSHRGGNPGFVRVLNPYRLSWPDYPGNSLYATHGNLELDPNAGLLFVDWEHGHTLQLTGRAEVNTGPPRRVTFTVTHTIETRYRLSSTWHPPADTTNHPKISSTKQT